MKVFVGGLAFETDETTLRKTFGECGEIESFQNRLPSSQDLAEKKRGIVFITYKTRDCFDKALALDSTDYYDGCTLKVKHAGDGKGKVKDSNQKGKGKDGTGEGKDGKGKGKDGKGKEKGKGKKEKMGQAK